MDINLVFREGEKTAVIIDPADNADYLKNKCREFGVKPEAVLLTHAHFDHMLVRTFIEVISIWRSVNTLEISTNMPMRLLA